jgi:hypothetical protein
MSPQLRAVLDGVWQLGHHAVVRFRGMVHLKVLHLEAAAAPAEPSSLKSKLLKRKVTLQTWRKFWRKKWRTFNRYLIKVWQRFGEISTKVWPLFDESWRKDDDKTEEIKYFDWKLLKKIFSRTWTSSNITFFQPCRRSILPRTDPDVSIAAFHLQASLSQEDAAQPHNNRPWTHLANKQDDTRAEFRLQQWLHECRVAINVLITKLSNL